jgi:hypothetical protein
MSRAKHEYDPEGDGVGIGGERLNDPIRLPVTSAPAGVKDRAPIRIVDEIRVVTASERTLLLARRQAILIELGGIEDYLGMERSVVPRHRRDAMNNR